VKVKVYEPIPSPLRQHIPSDPALTCSWSVSIPVEACSSGSKEKVFNRQVVFTR